MRTGVHHANQPGIACHAVSHYRRIWFRAQDLVWLAVAIVAGGIPNVAGAGGGPENVLLLVNTNSDSSRTIANHYIRWRQIPDANVVHIDWPFGVEICNGNVFRSRILQPALDAIEERKLALQIDYVVYSSDFPWMIDMREEFRDEKLPRTLVPVCSLTGATYLWPHVVNKVPSVVLPDVNWYLPGRAAKNLGKCQQLGSVVSRGFRYHYLWTKGGGRTKDTKIGQRYLLSTMLGVTSGRGNTVDEVLNYLRRSIGADATHPNGTFYFMKQSGPRSDRRHGCYAEAAAQLQKRGQNAVVLNGDFPQARGDVLGVMAGVAKLSVTSAILPGAICDHLTSFGGDLRANASHTPLTEFLRHGAAGAAGTVFEPHALQSKFPLPSVHLHYTAGCSLAEAFYQSIAGPYQLLIVGDPLCQPWATPPAVRLEGVEPQATLSGEVELTVKSMSAPGRRVAFEEVYVDGRLQARFRSGTKVPLDSTKLADGYHELRVVGIDSGPVESQGRRVIPVQVDNHGTKLDFEVSPAGTVPAGTTIQLAAEQPGATSVRFVSQGRQLGRIEGPGGKVEISGARLGRGPVRVQAFSDGPMPTASEPIWLEVK